MLAVVQYFLRSINESHILLHILKEETHLNQSQHVFGCVQHKTASDNIRQPLKIAGICSVRLLHVNERQPAEQF